MKKQIALLNLNHRNFKGIREFKLDTQNGDVDILGDNATGKTSLFDSFTWLLFDKDSQGKTKFDIKTLDQNNNALHGLEHEVEGVLLIDGKKTALRKVYAEKWTKKRGAATSEFTGHTTTYYINDAPVNKSVYDDKVSEIVVEDIFKLLTSPTYFNEQLDKKDRRKILLDVCGDISDSDVITSNKELNALPAILGDRSLDAHRDMVKANQKKVNEELRMIPVRIDELSRSTPDTDGLNEAELQQEIKILNTKIEDKKDELSRIQSGGEVSVKEKLQREIEGVLQQIKNRIEGDGLDKVTAQRKVISQLEQKIEDVQIDRRRLERQLLSNEETIGLKQSEREKLVQDFEDANGKTFENHDHQEECPSCGQSLPAEQVAKAFAKAVADFNQRKAEKLETIRTRGKAAVSEMERLKQLNIDLSREIETLQQKLGSLQDDLRTAESELMSLRETIKDATTDPAYIAKQKELFVVKDEIQQLRESVEESTKRVSDEIAHLRYKEHELGEEKAKFAQVKAIEKRIAELSNQEKELAAQYEQLEKELFLTEEFIRTKVKMLESKINSKFKITQFKLFEQQVNGALNEVCEAMHKGIPYNTGLNKAAQTNVGLDIINTLSEYHKVTAPIFIDNAESVTKMLKTDGQQIRLVVSEPDRKLRVEHKTQEAI